MDRLNNRLAVILIFGVLILRRSCESACDGVDPPWVRLSSGCIRGLNTTTVLGRPIFSFLGIPYAAPPLGDLRFRAPQPVAQWPGVLGALEEPPACNQPWREVTFPIVYSEDCLYLSVHTPQLKPPNGRLLPVIVWIHGGKYYQGSGTSYKYGPDFLLAKDIVYVSVNYRLGVFGHLNMKIPGAQGNTAMKDKIAALRWVKSEIRKFGGDPNSVTIAGGSSGAGDVNYLLISPLAKGLFHRAISNSGAAICHWAFLPSTAHLGVQLAETLGCPTHSPQALVSCLRSINSSFLAEAQMALNGTEGLENPFVPSIEDDLGEEVFLPKSPLEMIGSASGVPYMIGINNGEGLMFVDNPNTNPQQPEMIRNNFMSYLPTYILNHTSDKKSSFLASYLYDFYIGDDASDNDTMYHFVDYMTDKQFGYCSLQTAQIMSTKGPVYLFYFTFEGAFQYKGHSYLLLNMSGVCHGEELGYLFYRPYTVTAHNNLTAHPDQLAMVDKMVTFWANFAAYGHPTPIHQELNVTWEPVEGTLTNHLVIGTQLEMVKHPLLPERVAAWNTVFQFLRTSLNVIKQSSVHHAVNAASVSWIILAASAILFVILTYKKLTKRNRYTLIR